MQTIHRRLFHSCLFVLHRSCLYCKVKASLKQALNKQIMDILTKDTLTNWKMYEIQTMKAFNTRPTPYTSYHLFRKATLKNEVVCYYFQDILYYILSL